MSETLTVDGLSFSYKKGQPILRTISFSLAHPGIYVLLGRNGCGKSTLLDCLIGYRTDYAGTVCVNGTNICTLSPRQLAARMTYVPQTIECRIDYSVMEFLLIGRTPHLKIGAFPGQTDYDIAERCAERCGIRHLLPKSIQEISGGERQLVFLAKALVQQTPVILMDEPLSALDLPNQHSTLQLIADIAADEGKTVLLSTHNPNHALALGADVFLMDAGRIVDTGKAKEVVVPDRLKRIYGDGVVFSKDVGYDEITFGNTHNNTVDILL